MNSSSNKTVNNKFSFKERLKSFKNAFSGFFFLLRYEHNARIHLVVLIVVILAGIFFRIKTRDWIAITLAAGLVFSGECFNTAIEYLADFISPEYNEKIKRVKDIAAAGVLISAIISVLIGIAVFLPRILKLFSQ